MKNVLISTLSTASLFAGSMASANLACTDNGRRTLVDYQSQEVVTYTAHSGSARSLGRIESESLRATGDAADTEEWTVNLTNGLKIVVEIKIRGAQGTGNLIQTNGKSFTLGQCKRI